MTSKSTMKRITVQLGKGWPLNPDGSPKKRDQMNQVERKQALVDIANQLKSLPEEELL